MGEYKFAEYFERKVLQKRPYLRKEWRIAVVERPTRSEPQGDSRYRFWAPIPELGGRYLRVITLADKDHDPECFSRPGVQTVKLSYFADTDSLYIDLSEEPSVESREISEGVVLDYNAAGRLVGIDIDEASKRVQMDKLVLSQLPSTVETAAA